MLAPLFRSLPPFKGKNRLAKLFFNNTIENETDLTVRGSFGIDYLLPNLKENVGFDIFVNGTYEREYIDFLVKNIPEKSTFLDLGANIGSICIPVAKLRPDLEIIGVEASPRVFSYLKRNVEKNNCRNISIENYALSDTDNSLVPFYSPEVKFGKGSMSPVFTNKPEMVTSITLDTLAMLHKVDKVGFIKIDVEGFEALVFRGGKHILSSQDAPPVLFEFAHWAENQAIGCKAGDAQSFLLGLGYKLSNLNSTMRPVPIDQVQVTGTIMILAQKQS